MTKALEIAMFIPLNDCEYILECVSQTLRENGVPKCKALKPLTEAAHRLLSVSIIDRRLKARKAVVRAEARRIALKLLAA